MSSSIGFNHQKNDVRLSHWLTVAFTLSIFLIKERLDHFFFPKNFTIYGSISLFLMTWCLSFRTWINQAFGFLAYPTSCLCPDIPFNESTASFFRFFHVKCLTYAARDSVKSRCKVLSFIDKIVIDMSFSVTSQGFKEDKRPMSVSRGQCTLVQNYC